MHTAVICAASYRVTLPIAYCCASYSETILNDMNKRIAWIRQEQVPGFVSETVFQFHFHASQQEFSDMVSDWLAAELRANQTPDSNFLSIKIDFKIENTYESEPLVS